MRRTLLVGALAAAVAFGVTGCATGKTMTAAQPIASDGSAVEFVGEGSDDPGLQPTGAASASSAASSSATAASGSSGAASSAASGVGGGGAAAPSPSSTAGSSASRSIPSATRHTPSKKPTPQRSSTPVVPKPQLTSAQCKSVLANKALNDKTKTQILTTQCKATYPANSVPYYVCMAGQGYPDPGADEMNSGLRAAERKCERYL